jgi:hypothetical protein
MEIKYLKEMASLQYKSEPLLDSGFIRWPTDEPLNLPFFSKTKVSAREYWMIYSWPTMLSHRHMIWLYPPFPLSRQQVFQSSFVSPVELSYWRVEGGGGRGTKSYDGEKAWSSINHSLLSGPGPLYIIQYSLVLEIIFVSCCIFLLNNHQVTANYSSKFQFLQYVYELCK